ncbi:MAG TPA: ABC transporter ATP-binding protein [Pyrinomonadaceae bacterium]|nr:ABC transporter ATP-binding protein [Pyrinomonadaceae bacterium]
MRLEVTDLRKSFVSPSGERVEVLRGISFSTRGGQAVAITGPSGSGKTTLLNLIGGLETPDHGSIVAGDFAIDSASETSLARFRQTQVGFVFQFHHLLADLSAIENAALPLAIGRMKWHEAQARAGRSLEMNGLGDRMTHAVRHLSGGEQQRVAVCRALITNPSLVLADEPTGNLDPDLALEISKTMVDYARNDGATVILATHNEALAQLCDGILRLTDGKLSEGSNW